MYTSTYTRPTGDTVNLNAPGKYREIGWRWLEISVMIEHCRTAQYRALSTGQ